MYIINLLVHIGWVRNLILRPTRYIWRFFLPSVIADNVSNKAWVLYTRRYVWFRFRIICILQTVKYEGMSISKLKTDIELKQTRVLI
jgi:hypothetical protein